MCEDPSVMSHVCKCSFSSLDMYKFVDNALASQLLLKMVSRLHALRLVLLIAIAIVLFAFLLLEHVQMIIVNLLD